MTVQELINELEKCNKETEIAMSFNDDIYTIDSNVSLEVEQQKTVSRINNGPYFLDRIVILRFEEEI